MFNENTQSSLSVGDSTVYLKGKESIYLADFINAACDAGKIKNLSDDEKKNGCPDELTVIFNLVEFSQIANELFRKISGNEENYLIVEEFFDENEHFIYSKMICRLLLNKMDDASKRKLSFYNPYFKTIH